MDPFLTVAAQAIDRGRTTFRFDTFGSEAFWGDRLKLHQAIAGSTNGGVGAGLSPKAALALGLKVDAEAIPPALAQRIRTGQVDLEDPATTLALLKLNAVIGVTGFFAGAGGLTSMGIQCAFCHSTVDDSLAPGIGKRLDGWPNRDLDAGSIVALAPDLSPYTQLLGVDDATVRAVLRGWGVGKFDAELALDGKAARPDGKSAATLLPAAFGLAGVAPHTWTGWGSVTHWNAFVTNLEMMDKGTLYDPRLDDAAKVPSAAPEMFGHVRKTADSINAKLRDLQLYQLAIPAPPPPAGTFDAQRAQAGGALFSGKARCTGCHIPPMFSGPGLPMHKGQDVATDDLQALRSPDGRYRTSPLAGVHAHTKGGFYHDGRFATLKDVVNHYDDHFTLGLSDDEKSDLVEYLKSL